MDYKDFDLLLEQAEGAYRARVLLSPVGQAVDTFTLDFAPHELEKLILRLGRTRRAKRGPNSPEHHAAKEIGGRLFDAVFRENVRRCFERSLDAARASGCGLRLRLRIPDAPELAHLPWEYLYRRSSNDFLLLSESTPLVRYIELEAAAQTLMVGAPIRVLAIVASPRDEVQLDTDQEVRNLESAMRDVIQSGLATLNILKGGDATVRKLRDELRATKQRGNEYHVLHFVGHGAFDVRTDRGALIFVNDSGMGEWIDPDRLGVLLHDHPSIRLVVLNSCEGARATLDDPFAGVAQTLVRRGLPAVIAMQFDITDDAAIRFGHEFYRAITLGLRIEHAVTEARKDVFLAGDDVEWATPVLYLRSHDGQLFGGVSPPVPAGHTSHTRPTPIEPRTNPTSVGNAAASPQEKPNHTKAPVTPAHQKGGAANPAPVSASADTPPNANTMRPSVRPPVRPALPRPELVLHAIGDGSTGGIVAQRDESGVHEILGRQFIVRLCRSHAKLRGLDLFVGDAIPARKRETAVREYGSPDDAPLALYDQTIFGGGSRGFMVTARGIYLNSLAKDHIRWRQLATMTLKRGNDDDSIMIGTTEFPTIEPEKVLELFSDLQKCCREAIETGKTLLDWD